MAPHITDEQAARMVLVIEDLARRGNVAATGIASALAGKPLHEQRNLLLGFYSTLFEVLSGLHMALMSDRPAAEVAVELESKLG